MRRSQRRPVALSELAAGIVAGTLPGLCIGVWTGIGSTWWPQIEASDSALVAKTGIGLIVVGVPALLISSALALHGAFIGTQARPAAAAACWGFIPGIVFGISLGPVFAGVLALAFGNLAAGIPAGLIAGPIAGVVGWQTAYWLASRDTPAAEA